ncbi:MAG: hypothetical protein E6G68_01395 [Actinobacteria bacterium]|nr:MAG: hypothetical protein E6G68_01395 [Actinomycetota bacterium]
MRGRRRGRDAARPCCGAPAVRAESRGESPLGLRRGDRGAPAGCPGGERQRPRRGPASGIGAPRHQRPDLCRSRWGAHHHRRGHGHPPAEISGSALGSIIAHQVGKLAPEAGTGPGYTGDPDNYGCGFLDAGRLVTTAIGNTLPGQPANGQLFLWFGPFDTGFREETEPSGVRFFVGEVGHCQIDDTLATAGGIAVDRNGDVYVATNRPDGKGKPGGVWRFRGRWPSTLAECTPDYLRANIHRELIVSPDDTLYVSSVFTGTVSEYTKAGNWVRDIYPLSPVTPPTGPTGNTPYGLAVTADGSLWIADLGIVLDGPVNGQGSLIKVPFDANRNPKLLGQTVRKRLTFPDGLGVYTPAS